MEKVILNSMVIIPFVILAFLLLRFIHFVPTSPYCWFIIYYGVSCFYSITSCFLSLSNFNYPSY